MNATSPKPISLALSTRGQVALCRSCQECITLEFGFILQLFSRQDFLVLEQNLWKIDASECLSRCPSRNKVILSTSFPDLYFTFSEVEFVELRQLLTNALGKLQLIEASERHLN